jgi:UDP-glucose 4-epimerase
MRILVTGGAGFIGSHVVDTYVAAGHEVVVVDDLSAGRRTNVISGAALYPMDVNSPELDELLRFHAFDVVNHHAAQPDVRRSIKDPAGDADINIGGTIRLLELCRRHRVRGLIFGSSGGAIYGDQVPVPTPEDALPRPASPYGIGKLAAEGYVDYYRAVHGLPAVVLRYANVYGPRQDPQGGAGVVATFCRHLLQGQVPVVYGDGEQTRDFVYVGDAALANLLALDLFERHGSNGDRPNLFNIGTGQETTVNALLARLLLLADGAAAPRQLPARVGEPRRSALDPTRAWDVLGWAPVTSLDEGLGLTFEWFQRHLAAEQMRSAVRSSRRRRVTPEIIPPPEDLQAAMRDTNGGGL